ncbi:hypothetical protein ACQ4PT_006560 [Festuca glaucescens]
MRRELLRPRPPSSCQVTDPGTVAIMEGFYQKIDAFNGVTPPRERDASIICHVHHALRHYNAKGKGLDFVPVKPLMAAYVGFKSHIWVHVSFLARTRKITSSEDGRNKDNPIKHFFAELRYDYNFGTPTVETCTIIGK